MAAHTDNEVVIAAPIDVVWEKMNDVEKQALWAYLESLPPQPFGGR